jgi:hypothetical protein
MRSLLPHHAYQRGTCGAVLVIARALLYLTLFTSQSSTTCATSRLFFSVIAMCPLPWMPLSYRRIYSVLTPA